MKLSRILLIVVVTSIVFTSCAVKDNSNKLDVSETKQGPKFSYNDIIDASVQVVQTIDNEFMGCHLVSLIYDADRTEKEDGDVIVLYSVFTTDSSHIPGVNSSMTPNETYEWYWWLERDEKSDGWVIYNYGWD